VRKVYTEETYKEKIHQLWEEVFWAASHPTRLHILTVLYGFHSESLPQNSIYFTDLRDKLGLENSEMVYHLKLLQKAGLVENVYPAGERNTNRSSVYEITPKGIEILESLRIPEMLQHALQEKTSNDETLD